MLSTKNPQRNPLLVCNFTEKWLCRTCFPMHFTWNIKKRVKIRWEADKKLQECMTASREIIIFLNLNQVSYYFLIQNFFILFLLVHLCSGTFSRALYQYKCFCRKPESIEESISLNLFHYKYRKASLSFLLKYSPPHQKLRTPSKP